MLKIGEFARLAQVSVKTLRHYGAMGLLEPAAVSRDTGYRYYLPEQLRRLRSILALRDLGLSLDVVRDLTGEGMPAADLQRALLARRDDLERSIALHRIQLVEIEARLCALQEDASRREPDVQVKHTAARRVASIRSPLGSYDEAEGLFSDLARRVGCPAERALLGAIWHRCGHDGRQIDCEAFLSIGASARVRRGLSGSELPAMTVVSVLHHGRDEYSGRAYAAIRDWIARRGWQVSGPNLEIYLSRSQGGSDDDVTEIQFPIH
jgi:DNA-binding transcriptional MerR regulator